MAKEVKDLFNVKDKHVIVTGAAGGLGKGLAEGFLERGSKVVLMDRDEDRLNATVEEFKALGYDAYAVAADLSEKPNMDEAFDKAMVILEDTLDVFIPAAGCISRIDPWEVTEEQFDFIQKINLRHPYFMGQRAMKVMMAHPERGRGKIIFISSIGVFRSGPRVSPYSCTKGAIFSLAKNWGNDLATKNVNVNCICPGYINTTLISDIPADQRERSKTIPMERYAEPEDLKGLALFLGSAASDYITGENIVIDGGFTNRL